MDIGSRLYKEEKEMCEDKFQTMLKIRLNSWREKGNVCQTNFKCQEFMHWCTNGATQNVNQ